jgi:phage terminase Nu1 subunit (DNA packaging protein)
VRKGRKPIVVTERELAQLFAVHVNTAHNWVKAGLPARKPGRRLMIELGPAIRWVREKDAETCEARIATIRSTPDMDAARARKLTAEARIAEANAATREGELVPAAQVGDRWGRIAQAVREGVLSLAPTAVQHGIVAADREEALDVLCRDVLRELADRGKA